MGAPYDYGVINLYNSQIVPSTVHVHNTAVAWYFRRYLWQKAISVFKWKLPKTWSRDYFLYTLYGAGYICIADIPGFGVIPQWATVTGYNIFYQPKEALITNPAIKAGAQRRTIDKDCTIIKLEPDYHGISDMVEYYVSKLSLSSEAVDMDLINSKLAYVLTSKNKAMAESLKKLFDRIMQGEPAVAIDKELLDENGNPSWLSFTQDLKNNYIVTQLLQDMQELYEQFSIEVGIPRSNLDGRDRVSSFDVTANTIDTRSRAALWLDSLEEGCDKANEMFPGINISVDWRYAPDEIDNVSLGPVSVEQPAVPADAAPGRGRQVNAG